MIDHTVWNADRTGAIGTQIGAHVRERVAPYNIVGRVNDAVVVVIGRYLRDDLQIVEVIPPVPQRTGDFYIRDGRRGDKTSEAIRKFGMTIVWLTRPEIVPMSSSAEL